MDHYANQQLSPTAKRTRTSVGDPCESHGVTANQPKTELHWLYTYVTYL